MGVLRIANLFGHQRIACFVPCADIFFGRPHGYADAASFMRVRGGWQARAWTYVLDAHEQVACVLFRPDGQSRKTGAFTHHLSNFQLDLATN
jgi:hypothetical protein